MGSQSAECGKWGNTHGDVELHLASHFLFVEPDFLRDANRGVEGRDGARR
jgi:hypothetical protein